MDKDQIKGKMDEVAGRIKRQTGEWTGDKDLEAEGAKDQIKGKAEGAVGKVKDAARNLKEDLSKKHGREDIDRDKEEKEEEDVA